MSHTFPPPPAAWLASIIQGLAQCLGRCVGPNPRGLSGLPNPRVPDRLLVLIWERLRSLNARFAKRLARHAAGLTAPCPNAVPPAAQESIITGSAEPAPEKPSTSRPKTGAALLPRNHGWLLRLIQETAACRSQFRDFLEDSDITALLAADPRLRSILRPLCHALGIPKSQVPSLYPPPDAPTAAPLNPGNAAPQAAPAAFPPGTPPPSPDAQTSVPAPSVFSH